MRREGEFGTITPLRREKMKKCQVCGNKAILTGKYISKDRVCKEYECLGCGGTWIEVV
jgi:hypothetical protein